MKRIGLYGGTYDPPHIGHLLVAETVLEFLELDEIWFIPNASPPHKRKSLGVSNEDRVKMLSEATKDHPAFKVDEREMNRGGASYTVDTLRELKEEFPVNDFYFIIGADSVETLPTWKEIDVMLELVHFVAVNREGYQLETSYPVTVVPFQPVSISSTDIRERIASGKSIRYRVPTQVEKYIRERKLYES
ncbi:nicotinate-nucleotide adenylyltransferase [Mangrovibacillus cuniculi]|uniref:Probable nicotinate-nucleotide adenylyltransferase n=1 Tax=Mangrovibacillus cuniculi TaxID=2593652 RepID=A0A7S8HFW2_9BACI|nr:nicotinate-nucleotide adenylyltransferase [Mangrovibacillus cuniculi]QPC46956.1 nicotinate-nucleotide adenylyltransferase [Mangrovibacillus cuniculi]